MRLIDADALKERLEIVSVVTDDLYGMGINRGLDRAETEIDMLPVALSDKEILALRAVAYGANTNKKLVAGFFTVYNDDRSVKEMIPFDEAIETVYALLDKIMEVNDDP